MSNYKTIASLEDLFVYVNELEQGAEFQPIKLTGKISLALHIEGQSWDGRLDKRTAQYVVDLQKTFEQFFEEYTSEEAPHDLLIKVGSRQGSWESFADITQFMNILVGKMTDEQSFYLLAYAITLIGGYKIFKRFMDRKENAEIEQERNRTLQAAFQALEKRVGYAAETMTNYERPVRSLVKTLDDNDTITIGETAERMPAYEAKTCGPKRAPRSEETLTYADGNYTVNAKCYDEGEVVLELEQGGQTIKAYLSLFDEQDRKEFRESLNQHEQEDALPFSIDLQLNVYHTKRRLKYAVVVKEGAPREGKNCKPLSQIIEKQTR